jgi:hypothetical protein
MRDEWRALIDAESSSSVSSSGSVEAPSQGLTSPRKKSTNISGESIKLTMAARAMRLKPRKGGGSTDTSSAATPEVSERRQVGDADVMVNPKLENAWWRKVGMEDI